MGCCGSSDRISSRHEKKIVKAQAIVRGFLVRNKVKNMQDDLLSALFELKEENYTSEVTYETAVENGEFPYKQYNHNKKVYFKNKLVDIGDGKKYKGQWAMRNNEETREGFGVLFWEDGRSITLKNSEATANAT